MDTIEKLIEVTGALRDPEKGCPWHREQDFSSITPHTLEEAYELVDAIGRGDMRDVCDELGDLLFHVVYYAGLAKEAGHFDFNDVVVGAVNKQERRHPHVFGNETVADAAAQTREWEKLKSQERAGAEPAGLLDGVVTNLPALSRSQKLQLRAASAGFDWDNTSSVMDKLDEEISELRTELTIGADKQHVQAELGDLLFSIVNLARHLDIDAETALRNANTKFERRFRYIERALRDKGRVLESAGLEEMDRLWNEAKQAGR